MAALHDSSVEGYDLAPSAKRPRLDPFSVQVISSDDEVGVDGEEEEFDFEAAQQRNDEKVISKFKAIFEKYGRDFDGIGDEIDLVTGEVVINNGHLQGMRYETDVGADLPEGRRRKHALRNRFVRALTVEPSLDVIEISDSEEGSPPAEEEIYKCEACWDEDREACPHVTIVPKATPTKVRIDEPLPEGTLEMSRLRQFGARLAIIKKESEQMQEQGLQSIPFAFKNEFVKEQVQPRRRHRKAPTPDSTDEDPSDITNVDDQRMVPQPLHNYKPSRGRPPKEIVTLEGPKSPGRGTFHVFQLVTPAAPASFKRQTTSNGFQVVERSRQRPKKPRKPKAESSKKAGANPKSRLDSALGLNSPADELTEENQSVEINPTIIDDDATISASDDPARAGSTIDQPNKPAHPVADGHYEDDTEDELALMGP